MQSIIHLKSNATVKEILRGATHQAHVRLNSTPLLIDITQPSYSLLDYRKLLSAYFYIYSVVEYKINQFLEKHPSEFDYASRCKLPWLSQDIAFFQDELPIFSLDRQLEIEHIGLSISVQTAC